MVEERRRHGGLLRVFSSAILASCSALMLPEHGQSKIERSTRFARGRTRLFDDHQPLAHGLSGCKCYRMTEKKLLADLADSKEPLLPPPTPSSSSPPRQTRTSLIKAVVALCALGSLWYQFGPSISTDGVLRGGEWGYLARFGRHGGCPHGKGRLAWQSTRLSEKDIQDTLLTVPDAESAKKVSRACVLRGCLTSPR